MSQWFYQSELLQPYIGAGAQANKPISFGSYESRLRNTADALLFIYLFTYKNLEQPPLLAFLIAITASTVTTVSIEKLVPHL